MKILMSPKTAHFKSGILFFNITERRVEIKDNDIVTGTDICFMLAAHSIYITLGTTLSFYVIDRRTGEKYGPYSDPISIVSLHLFGEYDNLIKFLRDSFVVDEETHAYEFRFNGMRYGKFTYDINANISKICREIYEYVPKIDYPFEYEFGATTYFAEGALEVFINKLNTLYNISNFNEETRDTDSYSISTVDRSSGYGTRNSDGGSCLFMNFSDRRHSLFFTPKRLPVGYFSFLSDGTQFADDVLLDLIDGAPIETVTNIAMIDLLQEQFGVSQEVSSVDIIDLSFFSKTFLGVSPDRNVMRNIIFVDTDNFGVVPFEIDTFTRTMTILSRDAAASKISANDRAVAAISENSVRIGFDADVPECDSNVLAVQIDDLSFCVDPEINRAYSTDGNVMAVNYISGMLNKAFV
jgi:hypothetical protein